MVNLTLSELECCLNMNQMLIDDTVMSAKVNDKVSVLTANNRLHKLNKQRDKIKEIIEGRLDEIFS